MGFEDIFDDSYKRVLSVRKEGKDFFESFYYHFLKSDKEIEKRFVNTDMTVQKKMLKKSFYNLFAFYASGQSDGYISQIAENHNQRNLDIRPEFYDWWLECLISTVKQYDVAFSDEVELAWRLVLTPGITYMKFKYDKV